MSAAHMKSRYFAASILHFTGYETPVSPSRSAMIAALGG